MGSLLLPFFLCCLLVVTHGGSILNQLQRLEKQMEEFQRFKDNAQARTASVAFSARLSSELEASSSPVKFNVVDTNIAGGYDSSTGNFRVPLTGVYYLTTYTAGERQDGPMYMRNNAGIICQLWVTDERLEGCSCSATLFLEAGDVIRVTGSDSERARIRGAVTGFAGHIISDSL